MSNAGPKLVKFDLPQENKYVNNSFDLVIARIAYQQVLIIFV